MRSRTYINLTSFTKMLIVSLLLLGFVTNQIKEYDLKKEFPQTVCTVLLEERSNRCGSGIRQCLKCKTCTRGKPTKDWIDEQELERILKDSSAEEKKYLYFMCEGSKNSAQLHRNWRLQL